MISRNIAVITTSPVSAASKERTTRIALFPGWICYMIRQHYRGALQGQICNSLIIDKASMATKYGEITGDTISELISIAGENSVFTEKLDIEGYAHDETGLANPYYPQVVVKPRDTVAVQSILALANQHRIPVTPRGAGTGLVGGAVPLFGGMVLSLERLNRILEIDENNFAAVVEAAVPLARLCEEVEAKGLYYPLHPGEMSATAGGTVNTNAGGMNAVKYGVTRQNILGLEAILPDGSLISSGGKYVKCSSGYDLTQLIIGSEGTLAVVTKVICKLAAKIPKRELLYVPFNDLQDAIDAVPEILKLKKYPTGLEFIGKDIIGIVEKYTGNQLPYHEYEAFLLIFMEGESEDEIFNYFAEVEEICKKHGAGTAMMPRSEGAKRLLVESREKFFTAMKACAPVESIDIVVPRSEIARFVKTVKTLSLRFNIPVITYGHAGDGNVHVHPLCVNVSEAEWLKQLPELMHEIFQAGVSFGGAISGEHGIGYTKRGYLPLQLGSNHFKILRGIKQAFDPNNILNPGKIF
jgi:glycolate oxidase